VSARGLPCLPPTEAPAGTCEDPSRGAMQARQSHGFDPAKRLSPFVAPVVAASGCSGLQRTTSGALYIATAQRPVQPDESLARLTGFAGAPRGRDVIAVMLQRRRMIYCDYPMSACTCSFRQMLCNVLSARVEGSPGSR